MSETVKEFQLRYDEFSNNEKMKEFSSGVKAFVVATTMLVDAIKNVTKEKTNQEQVPH